MTTVSFKYPGRLDTRNFSFIYLFFFLTKWVRHQKKKRISSDIATTRVPKIKELEIQS